MNKEIINFLIRAKKATYPSDSGVTNSSRPSSRDLKYIEDNLIYHDSYFGTNKFIGEEVLYLNGNALWSMNYVGRRLDETFEYEFLKKALLQVEFDNPFRGPSVYKDNNYTYRCSTKGTFDWFQGYETVEYKGRIVYECYYHGGTIS